jgi:energy-coupling factor transporter transmembrane protein EcfT
MGQCVIKSVHESCVFPRAWELFFSFVYSDNPLAKVASDFSLPPCFYVLENPGERERERANVIILPDGLLSVVCSFGCWGPKNANFDKSPSPVCGVWFFHISSRSPLLAVVASIRVAEASLASVYVVLRSPSQGV